MSSLSCGLHSLRVCNNALLTLKPCCPLPPFRVLSGSRCWRHFRRHHGRLVGSRQRGCHRVVERAVGGEYTEDVSSLQSLRTESSYGLHKAPLLCSCKFLSALKHASNDVEDFIDDLEVLCYVLADIQRCEEIFGPQPATAKAIMRCRRQVQALENMVLQLDKEMKSESKRRRGQAMVKAVLKADRVKEFRTKISEAKETLSLALQSSSRSVLSVCAHGRSHRLTFWCSSHVQHTQFFAIVQGVGRLEGQMSQMHLSGLHGQSLTSTGHGNCQQSSAAAPLNSMLATGSSEIASLCSSEMTLSATSLSPVRVRRSRPRPATSLDWAQWGKHGSWTRSLLGSLSYKRLLQESEDPYSEADDEIVQVIFEPSWWLQALGMNTLFQAQIDVSARRGWKTSLRTQHVSFDFCPPLVSHYATIDFRSLRSVAAHVRRTM